MNDKTTFTLEEAERIAREELGVILFTVTLIAPGNKEISRVYTTHPEVYAVGGRKSLDPSYTSAQWHDQVVTGQQPFVGSDRAAVREFFVDYETIESLGCGSIINTPAVLDGETIGSVNFLAAEHALTQDQAAAAMRITDGLVDELKAKRDELWSGEEA